MHSSHINIPSKLVAHFYMLSFDISEIVLFLLDIYNLYIMSALIIYMHPGGCRVSQISRNARI